MKKKILTFLCALCMILPCAFIMTACGDNPPQDNPPPSNGSSLSVGTDLPEIYFTNADAIAFDDPELGENGNYAIWIADFYDKDTLQVLYDNEPVTLSYCDTPNYENKNICANVRKIATFSIPKDEEGEHNVTCSVDEEELELKFVSNGQEFTDDEEAILADWYFPTVNEENNFLSVLDTDFTLKTTYTEITCAYSPETAIGMPYACKKDMGYYDDFNILQPTSPELCLGNAWAESAGDYDYAFSILGFEENPIFTSKEIELTFVKERLKISSFDIRGDNWMSSILTIVDGEEEYRMGYIAGHNWNSNHTNDIKIYIEPYTNVDLSNVEVYIYDTKMTLLSDPEKQNKKYFVIPAGTMPVSYSSSEFYGWYDYKTFDIDVRNVDVSNADFITNFTVTTNNNNIAVGPDAIKYYVSNGVTYYLPNQQATACYSAEGQNIRPSSVTFNGTTFDLSDYVYRNNSVPVWDYLGDEPSQYRDATDSYYTYHVTIGTKPVEISVTFNADGSLFTLYIHFTLTGSTTVYFEV